MIGSTRCGTVSGSFKICSPCRPRYLGKIRLDLWSTSPYIGAYARLRGGPANVAQGQGTLSDHVRCQGRPPWAVRRPAPEAGPTGVWAAGLPQALGSTA